MSNLLVGISGGDGFDAESVVGHRYICVGVGV